jgi:hypothetical protein
MNYAQICGKNGTFIGKNIPKVGKIVQKKLIIGQNDPKLD